MFDFKNLDEAYNSCVADGFIRENHEHNKQKLKDLIKNAETNLKTANILIKTLKKDDDEWLNVYLNHYEALRFYTEAFLRYHSVKINNHQCLFVYLCAKFPDLELDWKFFETIRKKRNNINYYGGHVKFDEWKSIDLQIKLYISALKKEIETKIGIF
ncbi:hypothetical protein CMO93_00540 [Candidatus Woesearchaeota archaeon]|nr:hypothetical protein [Candidatus Woesearchaeota archaeon]|tara:strand:+ start:1465 stop:1935 length:471 start_codon:yes stop_codon:yes gene_type:complete